MGAGRRIDPRQAGDEGVEVRDKITAQMAGGEHRPEQQVNVPRRGRGARHGDPPGRPGRHRDREVTRLPGAGALSGQKVVVATANTTLADSCPYHRLGDVRERPYGASGMASRRAWSE